MNNYILIPNVIQYCNKILHLIEMTKTISVWLEKSTGGRTTSGASFRGYGNVHLPEYLFLGREVKCSSENDNFIGYVVKVENKKKIGDYYTPDSDEIIVEVKSIDKYFIFTKRFNIKDVEFYRSDETDDTITSDELIDELIQEMLDIADEDVYNHISESE